MHPLQLWLPNVTGTLAWPKAQRDRERAFKAWRGEDMVWLLPDLDELTRWEEDEGKKVLGIPADQLERLDIYHVGKNGYVWGPGAQGRFPEGRVKGLLDAFLNVDGSSGIEFYLAPDELTVDVPQVKSGKVTYESKKLRLEPGPILPVAGVDEETGTVSMNWPPDQNGLPTVSPEAESHEQFGPLDPAEYQGIPIAVSRVDPESRTLRVINKWPPPLTDLFPPGSGIDDMHACAAMLTLARKSQGDLTGALRDSKTAAGRYVTDGATTLWFSWLGPILAAEGAQGASFAVEARFNVQAMDLTDALQSQTARQALSEPVPIRRVWGAIGLFWALFLEQLEESRVFQVCEKCGRIIQGKKGKRFCGRKDDLQCFRQRRAADKRKERQRTE